MKGHFLRLIALSLLIPASFSALAQPIFAAPIPIAKTPLPNAQELLDNLFAPYAAAQTFRGTFDIVIKGSANKLSEMHLKTRYGFDERGDLARQDAVIHFVGRGESRPEQTLRFVDDGRLLSIIAQDQKACWPANQRDASPALSLVLKSLLETVVQNLNRTPNFVPSLSRGIDAGRPVFVLTAKHSDILRIVVDAQTRALRSLELSGDGGLSIRGSEQRFNEPINDAEIAWTPPADFKKVTEGDITFPPSLGITTPGRPRTVAPLPR
jgi:outer membrane lipoprotein-sorting protein